MREHKLMRQMATQASISMSKKATNEIGAAMRLQ